MDVVAETEEDEGVGGNPMDGMDPEMAAHPQPVFKAMREVPVMPIEGMGVLLSRKAEIDEALRHP